MKNFIQISLKFILKNQTEFFYATGVFVVELWEGIQPGVKYLPVLPGMVVIVKLPDIIKILIL